MTTPETYLSWQTEEYVHREKSPDWFWALGVIAVAGAALAVIYKDTLFAIIIVLAAIILGYYAARIPKIIEIAITDEGIKIKKILYRYKKIKGFAIDEHAMGNQLLIETDRLIAPIISIPIPNAINTEEIVQILETKLVHKEDMREHPTHRIMEHIGF
jgi:hypothetical protein